MNHLEVDLPEIINDYKKNLVSHHEIVESKYLKKVAKFELRMKAREDMNKKLQEKKEYACKLIE